jgi:hypothetical protein
MNLQLLLFAVTILITIESYPRALADLITSLPISLTGAFAASSRTVAARLSLFNRNLTKNSNHTVVPCSIQLTDQDLARELQGVAVFGEVCIIFTVLAIVVGEGLAWRKRRGARFEAYGNSEDRVTFEGRVRLRGRKVRDNRTEHRERIEKAENQWFRVFFACCYLCPLYL